MAKGALAFDDHFVPVPFRCLLWADEPVHERVRFEVATDVLKALGGGNPVHSDDNVALCERERSRIEAACRNAFAEGPSPRILVDVRHLLPGRQN